MPRGSRADAHAHALSAGGLIAPGQWGSAKPRSAPTSPAPRRVRDGQAPARLDVRSRGRPTHTKDEFRNQSFARSSRSARSTARRCTSLPTRRTKPPGTTSSISSLCSSEASTSTRGNTKNVPRARGGGAPADSLRRRETRPHRGWGSRRCPQTGRATSTTGLAGSACRNEVAMRLESGPVVLSPMPFFAMPPFSRRCPVTMLATWAASYSGGAAKKCIVGWRVEPPSSRPMRPPRQPCAPCADREMRRWPRRSARSHARDRSSDHRVEPRPRTA